ncbi:hypothetical protein BGZ76_007039 [Entomortierella beljakovae]|nr:hypothetical protein BGZ76_007039 [Entomortierella beljakovae]
MAFFKTNGIVSASKKNKTSSASNTPRTSVQLDKIDLSPSKEALLTPVEALDMLSQKDAVLIHFQSMAISRI